MEVMAGPQGVKAGGIFRVRADTEGLLRWKSLSE